MLKQLSEPPTDDWMRKMWHRYTMEYLLSHPKGTILTFVTTWMDPEDVILSEISQKGKDKHHMISLWWDIKQRK